jgi:hypothetical protein
MNLSELLNEITSFQKDSDTLQEIKKILNTDDTISVVEQVQFLQDNTSVNNVVKLKEKLSILSDYIDSIESAFEDQADEVSNALGYLESVSEECDYLYDARNLVDELTSDLTDTDSDLHKEEEPVAKKTCAKKTTFNPTTQQ